MIYVLFKFQIFSFFFSIPWKLYRRLPITTLIVKVQADNHQKGQLYFKTIISDLIDFFSKKSNDKDLRSKFELEDVQTNG